MDTLKRENVRPFTMIHTDFLDCETLTANEKMLLVILMRYNYNDGPPPENYPGLTGLSKKTGLAKRIVQDTLKALEDKGIIKKQARYMAGKNAHLSNVYTVRDVPSMWLPDTINNSMDLDMADATNRSIDLLRYRGYKVISPEEASSLGVGAPYNEESLSKKDINLVYEKRSFSVIYNDFLDCEQLKSKQKLILLLLMRYGGASGNDSKAFPSAATLARKTGMSVRSVRYVIAKLIDRKLIGKYARYDRNGGQTSNVYVVYDSPEIWQSQTANSSSNYEITRMVAKLQAEGYEVKKKAEEQCNEKTPKKDEKKKASSAGVGAPDRESLPKKYINLCVNNTLSEQKSQEKTEKNRAFADKNITKKEAKINQYTMQFLHEHYDYTSVSMEAEQLDALQNGYCVNRDAVDPVFDVLYDMVNCQQDSISIAGERRSTAIVVAKLLALNCEDIVNVIYNFTHPAEPIYNPRAWLRTALYHAKNDHKLDILKTFVCPP